MLSFSSTAGIFKPNDDIFIYLFLGAWVKINLADFKNED